MNSLPAHRNGWWGYVGLASGACFAKFRSDVAVVEADPAGLKALRGNHTPICEPGLDQLVAEM